MKTAWYSASLVALAVTLTGCATGPLQVSSDVQTFSSIATVATPATYRFERLPSQQAEGQQLLEQLAEPALAKVGLTRNDAAAQYNVQLNAGLRTVLYGPDYGYGPYGWGGWGPWGGPRFYGAYGRGGWGPGWGWGGSWAYMDTYPRDVVRDISVVLRNATNGQIVYETRASNYGLYGNDGLILSLMFEAALSGFPQPPQGPRRVVVTQPLPQPAPAQATPPGAPASAPKSPAAPAS